MGWYWRLKKGNIGNFKELCELFAMRFRGKCILEQDTSKLRKWSKENLKV